MESLEGFLGSCTLDEDIKETEASKKHIEKMGENRALREKRDLEDKEKRKKVEREKRKKRKANRHLERVAMLEKLSVEERKEFILKERAREKELETLMIKAKGERTREIVFDLSFAEYMRPKELTSLANQIARSIKAIKESKFPFAVHLSAYGGNAKDYMLPMGSANWIAYMHDEDVLVSKVPELDTSKLLYLSPDAEEVLQDFDEKTSFVIGGIVDRTVCPFSSRSKAKLCGIKTVRLPLKEYAPKTKKTALNINTVVETLLKYLETKNWTAVFSSTLPDRIILGTKQADKAKA